MTEPDEQEEVHTSHVPVDPEPDGAVSDHPDEDDEDAFEFGKFDESETAAETTTDESTSGQETPVSQEEQEPPKESDAPAAVVKEEKKTNDASPTGTDDSNAKTEAPVSSTQKRRSTSSGSHEDISKVEAEVCEAFFGWTESWNAGNLFGYLDAYWDSEQVRYISESLLKSPHSKGNVVIYGKKQIEAIFTDTFVKNKKQQERYKDKKGVAGFISLRKLIVTPTGSKNAIVFGEHQMEVAGDKRGTVRAGVFTIHVRKLQGKWKIVSEHGTSKP